VNRSQVSNYLRKAEQHLAESLEALSAERWDTAVLLAIHAAIAAVDAVCVASAGVRSASRTHADQPRLVRELLLDNEDARRAAMQLQGLIDRKNTVEYEARRCRPEDAQIRTRQAQRIVEWVRTVVTWTGADVARTARLLVPGGGFGGYHYASCGWRSNRHCVLRLCASQPGGRAGLRRACLLAPRQHQGAYQA
jgi:HEPN domain-containing protein